MTNDHEGRYVEPRRPGAAVTWNQVCAPPRHQYVRPGDNVNPRAWIYGPSGETLDAS